MKPYVIGVTGGVGAGKSELLRYIAAHYRCRVVETDRLANELKRKGGPCYAQIAALLGPGALRADGEIDRAEMARRIFADGELLKRVNGILHPAVRSEIARLIDAERRAGSLDFLFLEAALLIECGYTSVVDEMWYVYAPPGVRRSRLKEARGYSEERISEIMDSQLSDESFRAQSDVVIDNGGAFTDSCRQIDERLEGMIGGKSESEN